MGRGRRAQWCQHRGAVSVEVLDLQRVQDGFLGSLWGVWERWGGITWCSLWWLLAGGVSWWVHLMGTVRGNLGG